MIILNWFGLVAVLAVVELKQIEPNSNKVIHSPVVVVPSDGGSFHYDQILNVSPSQPIVSTRPQSFPSMNPVSTATSNSPLYTDLFVYNTLTEDKYVRSPTANKAPPVDSTLIDRQSDHREQVKFANAEHYANSEKLKKEEYSNEEPIIINRWREPGEQLVKNNGERKSFEINLLTKSIPKMMVTQDDRQQPNEDVQRHPVESVYPVHNSYDSKPIVGGGAQYDRVIPAAVQSKHSVKTYVAPNSEYHHQDHPVVDINAGPLPLTLRFNSHSTLINTVQHHQSHEGKVKKSYSVDEPDMLIQYVKKPVIQEIREIIQPVRQRTQEVRPVQEKVQTVIARDGHKEHHKHYGQPHYQPQANHNPNPNYHSQHQETMYHNKPVDQYVPYPVSRYSLFSSDMARNGSGSSQIDHHLQMATGTATTNTTAATITRIHSYHNTTTVSTPFINVY